MSQRVTECHRSHGIPQNVTECHKVPQNVTGMSQRVTECHGTSWNITECHRMSQNPMEHYTHKDLITRKPMEGMELPRIV